jgi:hypothetical protein
MNDRKPNKRISIEDCKKFAINHGGECLSNSYYFHDKLSWKCSVGHVWELLYSQMRNRAYYCLECSKYKRITIEDCKKMAKDRGGICLSDAYCANEKMTWQCKCGYIWNTEARLIKDAKSWCPKCNVGEPITLERAKKLALYNNGLCLSDIYDKNEKLKWKCIKGHEWMAKFNQVYNGHWCAFCSGNKLSIEDCKKTALEREGLCLSDVYENKHKNLKWRCKNGHEWEATFGSIRNQKSWCSKCKIGKGEQITRCIFEFVFEEEFTQIRPEWLIGSKNRVLELDGYCEKLNLAFEFQGRQHYEQVFDEGGSKDGFNQLIINDKLKKEICDSNNTKLIIIDGRIPYRNIIRYIKSILHEFCGNFNYEKYTKNIDLFTEDMFNLVYDSKRVYKRAA